MNKEDIESLNWKPLGSGWYKYLGEFGNLGYWVEVKLRLWGDNSFIKGYRGNEEEYLYQGKLGDKEYLKKLMYMINLHNQNE